MKTTDGPCEHKRSPKCLRKSCLIARGAVLAGQKYNHSIGKSKRDPERYASYEMKTVILIRDNYTCVYCEIKITRRSSHIDHLIPWSKGGRTVLANLVASCKRCNKRKAAHIIDTPPSVIPRVSPEFREVACEHKHSPFCMIRDCCGKRGLLPNLHLLKDYRKFQRKIQIAKNKANKPGYDRTVDYDLQQQYQHLRSI